VWEGHGVALVTRGTGGGGGGEGAVRGGRRRGDDAWSPAAGREERKKIGSDTILK
jgi:hypothetical protein